MKKERTRFFEDLFSWPLMYQTKAQRVVITVIGDGGKAVINCVTGFLITP